MVILPLFPSILVDVQLFHPYQELENRNSKSPRDFLSSQSQDCRPHPILYHGAIRQYIESTSSESGK